MNRAWLIVVGAWVGLASSFCGLVLVTQLQLGRLTQVKLELTDSFYPPSRPGPARRGAEVYRALGCVECHTQQVRPRGQGSDFERGWGQRRTVAQDYLHDYPVLLGTVRLGPDLANIGARQPDPDAHFKQLYNPRLLTEKSMMPSYAFLFETVAGPASSPAPGSARAGTTADLSLFPAAADPRVERLVEQDLHLQRVTRFRLMQAGYQVVPTVEAQDLVAYLLSLRSDTPLFEAPVPSRPATDAAPAAAPANSSPVRPATSVPANRAPATPVEPQAAPTNPIPTGPQSRPARPRP